jgi:MinD-like ATPase involved in chromosome partitioning or flagellar assembly
MVPGDRGSERGKPKRRARPRERIEYASQGLAWLEEHMEPVTPARPPAPPAPPAKPPAPEPAPASAEPPRLAAEPPEPPRSRVPPAKTPPSGVPPAKGSPPDVPSPKAAPPKAAPGKAATVKASPPAPPPTAAPPAPPPKAAPPAPPPKAAPPAPPPKAAPPAPPATATGPVGMFDPVLPAPPNPPPLPPGRRPPGPGTAPAPGSERDATAAAAVQAAAGTAGDREPDAATTAPAPVVAREREPAGDAAATEPLGTGQREAPPPIQAPTPAPSPPSRQAPPSADAPAPAQAPPPTRAPAPGTGRPEAERPPRPVEDEPPPRPVPMPGPASAVPAAGIPAGAGELSAEQVLARQPGGPLWGWQAAVYRLTGGRWRPPPGPAELARRELEARITAPVDGCRRIAVVALKGGVGKTTTTACLGATFADHRGDRVVAVDANPDPGTLGYRIRRDTMRTAKDLLADAAKLERYADVRAYASQTDLRLEVIASEADPARSEAFGEDDYRELAGVLERFYSLVFTDCGPGLLHSAMRAILPLSDQLVVVSAPSLDGARSASLTLDWLAQHGHERLARSSVVVINAVRSRGLVDIDRLEEHFARRCRAVVRVPFDRHLETGAEIVLDELAPATQRAYLWLAAAVADGFGAPAQPARAR